jgi:hypothetical protein
VTGDFAGSGTNNFDFSGSTGTFDTSTGAVTLRGDTTVASGKTLTAGSGTTAGIGVNVLTGNALAGGTALNVDTGTSAFSGNAVNITSGGNFTGTLVNLSANATAGGTVLGISTNVLTNGAVINANLGSSIYTGTAGALRLTANSASSGVLLAVSGTTLAANGGTAAQFTLGTPGGAAEPSEGKALHVALGNVGDAYYANAGSGYVDRFARFQVAGVDVFSVTGTSITTTNSFTQSGAATLSTGTGAISLNGDTTIAAGKNVTASGGSKLDFSGATGTFDTSSGAVTLHGDTTLASGKTLTAGAGTIGGTAVNVSTGNGLTGGTALNVDTGTSAFSGNAVHVTSGGAFTGTQLQLSANSTTAGTVLGISATSLTTGKAIDVQLAAAYTGGGTNQGAVNIRGAAFTGNLLSVSASSDAQTATSSLANFAAPLTEGHLLNLAVTGTYAGTGALYVDLTGATGTPTGTAIAINAASAYTGKFIDLQIAGGSRFAIDPTNGTVTSLNITQTGATAFSTGTGNITLNGNVVTNITQTGATTFSTGTGNISLNGNIVTNITQTGATTFSTGTGGVTLNGATTVSGANSFSSGTGAVTLNGNTSVVSGKTITIGGGTAIKVIELGTCTETAGSAAFNCGTGQVSGITAGNLLATDSITISQASGTPGTGCFVGSITPGTRFTINCILAPGNGSVFNVLVVRR